MKLNENVAIVGRNILLVPYKKHHVNKYHDWMKSPELLEKTASEPLTLEEEYQMQQSWWLDDDKCTFIILSKSLFQIEDGKSLCEKEIYSMAGDVNLYLNNVEDKHEAEVELMIADVGMRRNGFGQEATKIMMYFGRKMLNIEKFVVKIGCDNHGSIKLFTKLGFQLESFSEAFKESTYILNCENESESDVFKNLIYNEVHTYADFGKYDSLSSLVNT